MSWIFFTNVRSNINCVNGQFHPKKQKKKIYKNNIFISDCVEYLYKIKSYLILIEQIFFTFRLKAVLRRVKYEPNTFSCKFDILNQTIGNFELINLAF